MAVTRTVNNGHGSTGVVLNVLPPIRDQLLYKVSVSGPAAKFRLVDAGTGNILLRESNPPVQNYSRRWPTAAELQQISPDTAIRHALGMEFRGAVAYRFVVERHDADEQFIEVLLDVTWRSDQPDANRFETFTVSIPQNF